MNITKTILSAIFLFICFLIFLPTSSAKALPPLQEVPNLKVSIEGQKVFFRNTAPVMLESRVLVPLRDICEAMGANVHWNSKDRTVFISRKEKLIKVAVGSSQAFVNNQAVNLDAPAIIHKDSTLVPLRFVGEAFGGTVIWNGNAKTVNISLDKNDIIKVPELKVILNNKPLPLKVPPIYEGGKYLVPLEDILNGLESDIFYWEKDGNQISISLDGASIELFVGKNIAFINGNQVNTTYFPVEKKGTVMAPVRLITEVLGGVAHYERETNTAHLYINRPKFKTSFLEKEAVQIVKPLPVPTAVLMDSKLLMVSNNPEVLKPETIPTKDVTLWENSVETSEDSMEHRIFGWHLNRLNGEVKIGITLENLSDSQDIEITGIKGINRTSSNGWSNYDVGLPIAEAVLCDRLMKIRIENPLVKPGETVVLQSFSLEKDFLISFLEDVTIKNTGSAGELKYKIRTVLSQSGSNLATIQTDPVNVDKTNNHPRGNWMGSILFTELPVYLVGSGEVAYSISNGLTDHLLSEKTALPASGFVVGNPGHYGATYKIRIPLENKSGSPRTVRVRIGGRGGLYAGSVKTKEGVFITPILEPMKEVANVIYHKVIGENDIIEMEVMHAGGSALAMAVDIITLE